MGMIRCIECDWLIETLASKMDNKDGTYTCASCVRWRWEIARRYPWRQLPRIGKLAEFWRMYDVDITEPFDDIPF